MEALSRAVTLGFKDNQKLQSETDLNPLHDRDDFQRLLAELLDRGFPADPFAR